MTSTQNSSGEDLHEQLPAPFYVQSPEGGIYPADAQGRSDLVARGYTDITDFGGAEKFAAQNRGEDPGTVSTQPAAASTDQPTGASTTDPAQGAVAHPGQQAATPTASTSSRSPRSSRTDQADDTAQA